MTVTNPWVLVGVATVAPVVTALVAVMRSLLPRTARRRKNVLANLEFIAYLRTFEEESGVVLSSHVHDRARADLARSARLYVDRDSWKWIMAFPVVYCSFISALAYTCAVGAEVAVCLSLFEPEAELLTSLKLVSLVFSVATLGWVVVLALFLGVAATRGEVLDEFQDREGHLVPRAGPALVRPVGRPQQRAKNGREARARRSNRKGIGKR